jgi:hypothetical protein
VRKNLRPNALRQVKLGLMAEGVETILDAFGTLLVAMLTMRRIDLVF